MKIQWRFWQFLCWLEFYFKFKKWRDFFIPKIRSDCRDMWNAFMVKGATFSRNGIPFCPTTAKELPREIISYTKAREIFNKQLKSGDKNFFINAFVHFYQDDYKFDGPRCGIWVAYEKAVEILRHFAGIITPDFSTYNDFPFPIKIYNTYRIRAFGYWYGTFGSAVINNVRWGEEETFSWCFDGIPKNSVIAIGTIGSGLRHLENRKLFEIGFLKLLEVLTPKIIIIYGSDNYNFFDNVRQQIQILQFPSERSSAYKEKINE